jgi:transposase
LFPQLAGLAVERVFLAGRSVRIQARTCSAGSACPACGAWSVRVHSRYERRLADTAAGGQEMVVQLLVRRFFCGNDVCASKTFAEQVHGLTSRYGRRSTGLREALRAVALALGGRPGARLSGRLACPASRSTLLRMIRALPDPAPGTPKVLGVDDFALRRGHVYGTILVDIQTRRPVDMLPERSAESFRAWLDARPGVQVICRDRGGCYAEGAARGAPAAIQVADRWHLLDNLGEAVERVTARHRPCLRDEPATPATPATVPDRPPAAEGPRALRTRDRHAQVHAALGRGMNLTQISADLHLDRTTVRRYAAATSPDELLPDTPVRRGRLLDPHRSYLDQRWAEGCHRSDKLLEEIRTRGYRGSARTLRHYTAPLRKATDRPAPPPAPAPKRVAVWILTPPGSLTADDRAALARITGRCAELAATRALVREFADMLCNRHGHKLPGWADKAEGSDIRELRSFAAGLRKDWDAVTAGLTLPYSSGVVEGHVNRIKMIKRQMYGRAKPDLLRKRVLLAD